MASQRSRWPPCRSRTANKGQTEKDAVENSPPRLGLLWGGLQGLCIRFGTILRLDGLDQRGYALITDGIYNVHPLLFRRQDPSGAQLGEMLGQRGSGDVRRVRVQLAHRPRPFHQRAQNQEPVFIGEEPEQLRNSFCLFLHSFSPSFRFSACRSPASWFPSGSTHTTSADGTAPSS